MITKKHFWLAQIGTVFLMLALFWLGNAAAQESSPLNPAQAPLTSAFTYQGKLETGGVPVSNTCDMTFALFDDPATGSQMGTTQTITAITVTDGLFTASLNGGGEFGAAAFTGQARWLQIAVRCPAGTGGYTPLSPRQEVTATPYSIYSLSTGALQGFPISTLTPATADVLQYDGSQWAPSTVNARRQFYIAPVAVAGNAPLTACAAGYHMASLWEIYDVTELQYNATLGAAQADSGNGPPTGFYGWIRTGALSTVSGGAGGANCDTWTSNSGVDSGTAVILPNGWTSASVSLISPWFATTQTCSQLLRVWCVED